MIAGGNVDALTGDTPTSEVWWSPNGTDWWLDGSNDTYSFKYVKPEEPIIKLGYITENEVNLLAAENVFTIADLAALGTPGDECDSDLDCPPNFACKERCSGRPIIMKLRSGKYDYDAGPTPDPEGWRGGPFRYICPIVRRAQAVMSQCTVQPDRIDGQDVVDAGIQRYDDKGALYSSGASDGDYDWLDDGCMPPVWAEDELAWIEENSPDYHERKNRRLPFLWSWQRFQIRAITSFKAQSI